ncbi:SAM hydrolase/SAM-dependent halogenase family protein [Pirellulaceae bacterium SH467]
MSSELSPPIIALTTDFGASFYVGQLKGVLATLAPQARIIDLTHEIEPQSIHHGAIVLQDSVPWFPKGSIHIAVVDPGVGTDRRLVAADFDGRIAIGPDNGLLSALAADFPPRRIVHLNRPEFWATRPSTTFHARDIMAPVAAYLAGGGVLESLGDALEALHPSPIPKVAYRREEDRESIEGRVCMADRYGNLLTNVRIQDWPASENSQAMQEWQLVIEGTASPPPGRLELREIPIVKTYGEAEPGNLVALIGSSGRLEISIPNGNARDCLGGDHLRFRVVRKGMTHPSLGFSR